MVDGVPYADRATTLSVLSDAYLAEWLAAQTPLLRGRLLDAGAGERPFDAWYRPHVRSAVAVDVAPLDGLDALASLEALPFATGSFDVVLATEVLEHVRDAELATAELFRVLAPGGHAIVTVPFLYPLHEAPYDYRRLTGIGLADLLSRHGFTDVTVSSRGGPAALVVHAAVLAVWAAGDAVGRRAGGRPWSELGWWRAALAAPQELAVRRRPGRGRLRAADGLAGAASLGYLAVAARPGPG
jgi:SAM-dependent methyltransferase